MTGLIKTILETQEIQALEPDFSLLPLVPKAIAEKSQLLIFGKVKNKELKLLTTNNHPEEVKKLLQQINDKGYTYQLFYTSIEGFESAMQRYEQLAEQEKAAQEQLKKEAKAEGKSAIAVLKEQFEQRDNQDPTKFILTVIRLSFQS